MSRLSVPSRRSSWDKVSRRHQDRLSWKRQQEQPRRMVLNGILDGWKSLTRRRRQQRELARINGGRWMDGKREAVVIVRRRLPSSTTKPVELGSQEAFLQYRLQLWSRMQVLRTNQYSSSEHASLAIIFSHLVIQHTAICKSRDSHGVYFNTSHKMRGEDLASIANMLLILVTLSMGVSAAVYCIGLHCHHTVLYVQKPDCL